MHIKLNESNNWSIFSAPIILPRQAVSQVDMFLKESPVSIRNTLPNNQQDPLWNLSLDSCLNLKDAKRFWYLFS